jgi:hypothetical protein
VNGKDRATGTDFVAIGENGFLDARAIQESAVAAFEIEEPTALFTVFDRKVKAGHAFVVGNAFISFGVAADAEKLARLQRDFGACVEA